MLARFGNRVCKTQESALVCQDSNNLTQGHAISLLTLSKCLPPTRPRHKDPFASARSRAIASFNIRAPRSQAAAQSSASASSSGARQEPRATTRLHHRRATGGSRCWLAPKVMQGQRRTVGPNRSFNPRLATAGAVSLVRGRRSIVAYQAYSTRLRSRG